MEKQYLWHGEIKFPLVIVKGICEKDDGAAYFGSLIGYPVWVNEAKKLGLIQGEEALRITPLGLLVYRDGINLMPKRGRAVEWNWSSELLERARKMIEEDIKGKKPTQEQTKEF